MYIKPIDSNLKADNNLNLAFDIGKDKLDVYTEVDQNSIQNSFNNKTLTIEKELTRLHEIAISKGYEGLRIIAEPTGVYHKKLFRTARKMGHKTAIVNPESVYKFKVIESNDAGKTDSKDCRVIFLLAKYNKTLIDRNLIKGYAALRNLNTHYIEQEKVYVSLRCKIFNLLKELFCDYSFSSKFLYTNSGRQLVKRFKANPYRIIKYGYAHFYKRMKKYAPRMRNSTIQRLWQDAKVSSRHQLDPEYVKVLEFQFISLWEDLATVEKRKEIIENKMIKTYESLREFDPYLPDSVKGFITKFRIAQLLAETGPLSDFASTNQLMRYAGLNIRERKSGKFKGQNKISKKGRANLRRVLGYIVLPLVKKNALLGSRYHRKKDAGMPGTKAMVPMMRKVLSIFYGWYKSGQPFDMDRIFLDESQYKKLKEN